VALLVLDEHIANPKLVTALQDRGIDTRTVGDFGVTGRTDPEVVRRVQQSVRQRWVLVTMDLTIVEEHEGFDWERYALAWIVAGDALRGARVEQEKVNIVHRHALTIREQTPGDHFTYTLKQRFKHPPSVALPLRRRK
jgi:predicted nuclease of predicted toxin-antitoxin system